MLGSAGAVTSPAASVAERMQFSKLLPEIESPASMRLEAVPGTGKAENSPLPASVPGRTCEYFHMRGLVSIGGMRPGMNWGLISVSVLHVVLVLISVSVRDRACGLV